MMPGAFRSRAAALPTDLVLIGFAVAVILVAASFAYAIPDGLATAPEAVRVRFRDELATPATLISALAAALYAGFDYTLDLKNGVVAREATAQPRGVVLGARAVMAALGGAVIGIVCAAGFVVAAALAGAGWMLDPLLVLRAATTGLLAATWGFAVAVLVRSHLIALFAVPATLGIAVPAGAMLPQVAAWLPLSAIIGTVGADLTSLLRQPGAVAPAAAEAGPVVMGTVAAAWLVVVGAAALVRFRVRDIT